MGLPILAAGLMTVGRFAVTPLVRLLSTRLTVGGAAAMSVAPVAIASLDNLTGNQLSETVMETPLGGPLEALLATREWTTGQKAGVVSNAIELGLTRSDALEEDLPRDDTQIRLVDAMSHYVIGDMVGAASIASDLGLELSDVADAYNDARAENPDAAIGDVGVVVFKDLSARVEARKMGVSADAGISSSGVSSSVEQGRSVDGAPALGAAFSGSDAAELTGSALDSAYDQASNGEIGLVGQLLSKLVSFVESINIMGWADDLVDRMQRFVVDSAQDEVLSQGNLGMASKGGDFTPYQSNDPRGPEAVLG